MNNTQTIQPSRSQQAAQDEFNALDPKDLADYQEFGTTHDMIAEERAAQTDQCEDIDGLGRPDYASEDEVQAAAKHEKAAQEYEDAQREREAKWPFQCKCGNYHSNESDFCSPCLRGE